MRSREPRSDRVRVVPELRRLVEFRRLNFMDSDYGIAGESRTPFSAATSSSISTGPRSRILRKLTQHLVPGGYLFVGHAETLHDLDLPLTPVAPALYRRADAAA